MSFYQFGAPWWFLALLLLPLLAWLIGKSGPAAAVRFSSTGLVGKLVRRRAARAGRLLIFLRLLGLAALVTALARPQQGEVTETIEADGIDIVLTLDLSFSMRALDLATRENVVTRLDVAKSVLRDFIEQRRFDRISLVVFGPEAFVVSPLTLNHDWLVRNLDRLELGSIDGAGTAIGTALTSSVNRLESSTADSRIIILLTDGENNAGEITPIAAAQAAAALGIRVYTVATGSQGRVPLARLDRDGRPVRDDAGNPTFFGEYGMSEFDTSDLVTIAEMTGGRFFEATEPDELEEIYALINTLETTEIELRAHAEFTELFHWFALFGLSMLLLEQLLNNTRYRRLP